MQPLYICATDTIICDPAHRYVHPQTGEVYGGTDYANATKCAEIGAESLTVEAVPEGYRATAWTVVREDGQYIYRPTVEVIPPPTDEEKAMIRRARYVAEVDPLMHAALGYDLEAEAETDPDAKAALEAKAATARADYLATKAAIRQETEEYFNTGEISEFAKANVAAK